MSRALTLFNSAKLAWSVYVAWCMLGLAIEWHQVNSQDDRLSGMERLVGAALNRDTAQGTFGSYLRTETSFVAPHPDCHIDHIKSISDYPCGRVFYAPDGTVVAVSRPEFWSYSALSVFWIHEVRTIGGSLLERVNLWLIRLSIAVGVWALYLAGRTVTRLRHCANVRLHKGLPSKHL